MFTFPSSLESHILKQ